MSDSIKPDLGRLLKLHMQLDSNLNRRNDQAISDEEYCRITTAEKEALRKYREVLALPLWPKSTDATMPVPIASKTTKPKSRTANNAITGAIIAIALVCSGVAIAAATNAKNETRQAISEKLEAQVIARDAESKSKDATRKLYIEQAREAMRGGRWADALAKFEPVISDGPSDELQLREERLYVLLAVGDDTRVDNELRDLAARNDLGTLAAKVDLVQGMRWLGQPGRRPEALAKIQAAVNTKDLAAADEAFAKSLLAERPKPVIEALRRAVAIDQYHYPAHTSLVLALYAAGQHADGALQAAEMRRLFPDSPIPPLAAALSDSIYGRRGEMERNLATVEKLLGQTLPTLRKYIGELTSEFDAAAISVSTIANKSRAESGIQKMPNWWERLSKVQEENMHAFTPFGATAPVVLQFSPWYAELANYSLNLRIHSDKSILAYAVLVTDYLDESALSPIVLPYLHNAEIAVKESDLPSAIENFTKLSKAGHSADSGKTLFARTPLIYYTNALGIIGDLFLLKIDPNFQQSEIRRARIWAKIYSTILQGGEWKSSRAEAINFIIEVSGFRASQFVLSNWKTDTIAGWEAYRQRNEELCDFCEALVKIWLEQDKGTTFLLGAVPTLEVIKRLNRIESNNFYALFLLIDLQQWKSGSGKRFFGGYLYWESKKPFGMPKKPEK